MFKCLDNCAKCCYGASFTKECWDKNKSKIQVRDFEIITLSNDEFLIETPNHVCVFLNRQTKKCEIYEDRPVICKMYGTEEILPCPFLMPDGSPRPIEKMKDWEDAFDKSFNDLKNKVEQKLILI